MYTIFYGFWQDVSEVPNFIEDQKKAIRALSPGFTVVADVRNMKPPTKEIDDFNTDVLKILAESGLYKIALVLKLELFKMSARRMMKDSGILERVKFFEDVDEAEEWLDG
jgi:hypothetical protein